MTTTVWRAGLVVALAWWSGVYGCPLSAPGWAGDLRPDQGVDGRVPVVKPGADQDAKAGAEARFPGDLRAVSEVYPTLFDQPRVRKASEDWAVKVFCIDARARKLHQDDEAMTDWMRRVTCVAVHVILILALIVAAMEFYSATRLRVQTHLGKKGSADVKAPVALAELQADVKGPVALAEPQADVKTPVPLTELQVKADGIALKTSLHGSALLAFALAFYFLYIKFALPVT